MAIELHERLSEYSYGYGVTREAELLLASLGLRVTPFLPNLVHEAEVGFDVAFDRPGRPLLLQFKLGQELRRFHKSSPHQTVPSLQRPFWRFSVDVSAHQFMRLVDYENAGAEVYYVGPRFASWDHYATSFQRQRVLENSVLVRPSEISAAVSGGSSVHRVVYDPVDRYVCSEPRRLKRVESPDELRRFAETVRTSEPLASSLERLAARRRRVEPERAVDSAVRREILQRSSSPAEGLATLLGLEAWSHGAQMLLVSAAQPIGTLG